MFNYTSNMFNYTNKCSYFNIIKNAPLCLLLISAECLMLAICKFHEYFYTVQGCYHHHQEDVICLT